MKDTFSRSSLPFFRASLAKPNWIRVLGFFVLKLVRRTNKTQRSRHGALNKPYVSLCKTFPSPKCAPAFMTTPGRYHQVPEIVVEEQQKKNPFYATTTSLHQRYAGRQDRRKAKIIHKHKIFMQVSATGA